ncbi:MAG TPA: hypothetical protein VHH34_09455 [Pseudonocardiaceae bacterium]|nr:hypothetical protein [Pseudonocardiaceae bacterium]
MTLVEPVPDGYAWPGMTTKSSYYYLANQPGGWAGQTPLYVVCYQDRAGQRILAERAYPAHARLIVDALRHYHACQGVHA